MAQKSDREVATRTEEQRLQIRPVSDICEEEGKVLLRLEMPGVEKGDVDLTIDGNQLVITGKRQMKPESGDTLLRERRDGDFYQVFNLDETIDRNNVEASLEKGVLTVALHMKEEVKPRQISIKTE